MSERRVTAFVWALCLLALLGFLKAAQISHIKGKDSHLTSHLIKNRTLILPILLLLIAFRKASFAFGLSSPLSIIDAEDLADGVNHERQRVREKFILNPSATENFLICVPQERSLAWRDHMKSKKVDVKLVQHGGLELTSCYRAQLSESHINALQGSPSFQYDVFEPIPAVSKVDSSIHHMLHHGVKQQAQSGGGHPIINDFVKNEPLALDVYFSTPLSKQDGDRIVQKWKDEWQTNDHHNVLSDVWPASGVAGRRARAMNHLNGKQKDPFPHFAHTSVDKRKAVHEVWHEVLHAAREGKQAADASLHDYCALSRARFHVAKQRVLVYFDAYEADKFHHCLASMVSSMLRGGEVIKVALTKPLQTQNNNARRIVQTGALSVEPYTAMGLNGTGQVIGVSDTGIDEHSCFFRDLEHGRVPRSTVQAPVTDLKFRKVVQYINYSGSGGDYSDGHGSHVSGTLAGACYDPTDSTHEAYKGMASAAQLAFFDIGMNVAQQWLSVPDDLSEELYPPALAAGAKIHSNSWGGGYFFDAYCIATDDYLYSHDDFLVFFAAGNGGTGGAVTVISPSISKNAVAVGATGSAHYSSQRIDYVAPFSGNGPAIDGRLKPDITGPGYNIYSAKARSEGSDTNSCDTVSKMGTSMATPVVAGNAALVRQYFGQPQFWAKVCNPKYLMCQKGAQSISGYVLKALMLHSGHAVTAYDGSTNRGVIASHVPDYFQGYGRVLLSNILLTEDAASAPYTVYFDDGSVRSLSERTYVVNVQDSSVALKVTLSWFDPPNDIFASKLLLHDLDLLVLDPNGRTYYSNLPAYTSNPAYGSQRDDMNNNEQITIVQPAEGAWQVLVQAKQLTEAQLQKFALVITAKGEVVENNEMQQLSWSILQKCTKGQSGDMKIDVSLWSRIGRNGWDNNDFYTIKSLFDNSVVKDTMSEKVGYTYESVCLESACYEASLRVGSSNSHRGTQMELPQCGIYLSPFAPSQQFCVAGPKLITDPYPNDDSKENEVVVYDDDACKSNCTLSRHLELPVLLSEYSGAGWTSSYYAILALESASSKEAPNYSVSDSLEWGFEELQEPCLPFTKQCYLLQLSYPSGLEEEYPELDFANSFLIRNDVETSIPCPYSVNLTYTLAAFCTDPEDFRQGITAKTVVSFYKQTQATANLGQAAVDWSTYWSTYAHKTKLVGSCSASYNLVEPSAQSFDNMDYSCLSDCPNYPGEHAFKTELNETCYFLADVFSMCDSYSIAMGLCAVPGCAQDCSTEVWCYFGAGSATSCPYAPEWRGIGDVSSGEIAEQCSASYGDSLAGEGTEQNSKHGMDKSTAGLIIGMTTMCIIFFPLNRVDTYLFSCLCVGVSVMIGLIIVCFAGQYAISYYKNAQRLHRGERLPMQSEDRLSQHHRSLVANEEEGNDIETNSHALLSPMQSLATKGNTTSARSKGYEMVMVHSDDRDEVRERGPTPPVSASPISTPVGEQREMLDKEESTSDWGVGQASAEEAEHGHVGHFTIAGEDEEDDEDDVDHIHTDKVTAVHMARAILLDNDLHDT
ncbi:hypothetical protein EON64_01190, partial [archaeon]